MNSRTKKLSTLAMLCAISYLMVFLVRIPVVLFLSYEPKDVIITIGGFLFGPLAAFTIALLVSLVELFTISGTGIIGCIMNILASAAFACTASFIYKRKKSLTSAGLGLLGGTVAMTVIMILWNYLITPIYMGYPREAVAAMLVPVFLPFNLLKGGLNAAFTMLLYKPVVSALRKARLVPASSSAPEGGMKFNAGTTIASGIILITCILLVLVFKGVL